jgi:hypothetical protein
MACFSNGTGGESYYEEYCARCVHDWRNKPLDEPTCPVWYFHLEWNYMACDPKDDAGRIMKHVLDVTIPQDDDGHNLQCRMFIPKEGKP